MIFNTFLRSAFSPILMWTRPTMPQYGQGSAMIINLFLSKVGDKLEDLTCLGYRGVPKLGEELTQGDVTIIYGVLLWSGSLTLDDRLWHLCCLCWHVMNNSFSAS